MRLDLILILFLISLFLGDKTFGGPIDHRTPEFDGKTYSSSAADQTTDWESTISISSFANNSELALGDLYNKGERQIIRSADYNLFHDAKTVHKYLEGFNIGVDRFIPIEDFEDEFTDDSLLLFLSLILSILIGTIAAFGWQFYFAPEKHKKSAHRRKYWRHMRRTFSIGKKWTELTAKNDKVTYFRSN